MVLIDWRQISYPYLDEETPVLDAIVQRAKTEGVKTVIAAGEIIYQDGKFTKVDRDAALKQFSELLERPLNPDEIERRRLSKAVFPHVKSFYENYYSNDTHVPYYRQNSRV
jgi:5-methylthioadenosine/S-adenosylhomocysteine deaminase